MAKKFLRQDISRYSKLGKNRPKLQKWRKPKGRDSKMRLNRKSYPSSPTVGHKSQKSQANKIKDKTPKLIITLKDLNSSTEKNIIIISGKLGAKKKLDIIKQAQEKKLEILNIKEPKNETRK